MPEIRIRTLSFLLSALLALLPRPALAQFDSATVLGLITDETGAAVPGATVTLTNPATGIAPRASATSSGQYQFLNVRIGTYTLKAELQGFTTAVAENFTVTVNARQRVDLTMKVGDVGETVEVTGAARLLESESSDRGRSSAASRSSTCRSTGAPTPTSRCSAPASASRRSATRATPRSTSTACAARSTTSSSTASTTTPTAPATRASPTRSCRSRPTRSRSSRSRPTTSAPSSAAPAAR